MPETSSSRRAWLAGGTASLGLTACGGSPTLQLIASSFGGSSTKSDRYPMTAEQIHALPYASLGIRIGSAAPGVMVLATEDGTDLNWVSADRVVLVTRGGRIVKTVGLPRDLVSTQWTADDPVLEVARGGARSRETRVSRFVDLRPDDAYGIAVESTARIARVERITILDRSYETIVIEETVAVPKWRWSATNLFWFDQAGRHMLRSQQSYCEQVKPIMLEILKPAAKLDA